ncbi:MAG: hypothetical protein RLY56_1722 [Pseudomonadota bacterium]|jgi:hypothetical protein
MLSPVGLPPQAPVPPDHDLVPALDRAIVLPSAGAGSGTWQAGSLLSASVRHQNDEMILKVGDRFFSTRPIPGVTENSQLSLQVSRDPTGSMMLVPMLPLAGRSMARIGGAPPVVRDMTVALAGGSEASPVDGVSTMTTVRQTPPTAIGVQSLAAKLEPPRALADWLLRLSPLHPARQAEAPSSAAVGLVPESTAFGMSRGVSGWIQALTISLSNSGLFYESKLKDKRSVPGADIKRQLLDSIYRQPVGQSIQDAWAALDELVGFQSAANVAHQAGGCCYSFVLPAPDGLGAWWVVFQQDPRRVRDDEGRGAQRDDQDPPWRIRLSGIELPEGNIDIRLEQVGTSGVSVTLLTPRADRATHWESARQELSRRFEEAGLELARWAVLDPRGEKAPPSAVPGQLRTVRV